MDFTQYDNYVVPGYTKKALQCKELVSGWQSLLISYT